MEKDIKIKKLNESTLVLECSNAICGELSNYFSAFVDNYRYMPAYKSGNWSGRIYAFDSRTNQLPIGLLYKLLQFCKQGGYTYEKKFSISQTVDYNEFLDFVKSLNIPFEPRDYQLQAAYDAITMKHLSISSTTSSGKTLIVYIIIRWLLSKNLKVLFSVPNVQLVEQAFGDFYDYGWYTVEDECCRVYSGHKRLVSRLCWIGTWQSLSKEKDDKSKGTLSDKTEYESYDACIFDENHLSSASVLSNMLKRLTNSSYRIGLSGSYPDEKSANWLTIIGGTGQIKVYSTYNSLQEAGHIVGFTIVPTILQYPMETRLSVYEHTKDVGKDESEKMLETKRYSMESTFVSNLESRNEFLVKMCKNLNGNVLLLFKHKSTHGIPLYELIKNRLGKEKVVLYIDGDVDVKDRVKIQHRVEQENNIVLVGSIQTLGTGISISNLHHLILASGTKSKIKTIQAIGRLLRLNHNKTQVKIFDIVDDLSFKDTKKKIYFKNYSLKHYQERLKIYNDNEFKVEKVEYKIKPS